MQHKKGRVERVPELGKYTAEKREGQLSMGTQQVGMIAENFVCKFLKPSMPRYCLHPLGSASALNMAIQDYCLAQTIIINIMHIFTFH